MRLTIAEPFGIAGNFYYIGASDVAAFLLAGPEGYVCSTPIFPPTTCSSDDPGTTQVIGCAT